MRTHSENTARGIAPQGGGDMSTSAGRRRGLGGLALWSCLALCIAWLASGGPAWAQWQVGGKAICVRPDGQFDPIVVADGSGGAVIVWVDGRSSTSQDLYAQRVNAAGVTLWTANGLSVCSAAGNEVDPAAVSDGAGGLIVTWSDPRLGAG